MKYITFKIYKIMSNKYIALLLIGIIYYLRNYYRFKDSALWAEDGAIFLSQVRQFGFYSILMPYDGYLHIVIRVIAYVVNWFPLLYTPILYHLISYFILLYVAYTIINSRFIQLAQIYKNLLAIMLVTTTSFGYLPDGICGEIFITLTNIQWFTALILIIHILEDYQGNSRYMPAINAIFLGLQGPFSITLLPISLIRLYWIRRLDYLCFCCALAITSVIQISFAMGRITHKSSLMWQAIIKPDVIDFFNGFLNRYSIFAVTILLLSLLIWLISCRFAGNFWRVLMLSSYGVGIYMASAVVTPVVLSYAFVGCRYYFIPYVMFNWALIYISSAKDLPKFVVYFAILLIALGFAGTYKSFFIVPRNNYDWKEQVYDLNQNGIHQFTVMPEVQFMLKK